MKKEHFEVILEDINSKMNVVVEGQIALRQRMDEHEQREENRFAQVDQRFARVDQRFAQVDRRFVEMHNFIRVVAKDLSEKIGGVAHDLAEHRADTEAHVAVR